VGADRWAVVAVVGLWLGLAAAPAGGQTAFDPGGWAFRFEEDTGGPRGVVTGWLYNDGPDVVGLVRLRLEIVDGAGQVVARQRGWAYGNAAPGGRVYVRIAVPIPTPDGARRVLVDSFSRQAVVQSP
jgi:hypothetical protein